MQRLIENDEVERNTYGNYFDTDVYALFKGGPWDGEWHLTSPRTLTVDLTDCDFIDVHWRGAGHYSRTSSSPLRLEWISYLK